MSRLDPRVMNKRIQHWKQIVTTCNTSGIKKTDWLRIHCISEKSFYRWQKLFRDQALEELPEESRSPILPEIARISNGEKDPENVPALVDITAMISQEKETVTAPKYCIGAQSSMQPELMIQVDSYKLYIGSGVTEATLTTVLKVIGHA